MSIWRELYRAAVKENPAFVLVLGCCPTLAVTTAVVNGFWMAIAATGVLVGSNVIISLLRRVIPKEVRIPCFVIVIGGFVTMTEMLLKAYVSEEINRSLGVFIPLIVVNCIIFGRAEAYAYTHTVVEGLLDGVGMGIGYMGALLLISGIREAAGAGTILGLKLWDGYEPAFIMVMAPGAFLVIGLLLGVFNAIKLKMAKKSAVADVPRPVTAKEMAPAGN